MEETSKPDALGSIRSDEVYPLPVFQRLLGLNAEAMRKARRKGLKSRRIGRRRYIVGAEAVEFVRTCPEA